MAPHDWPTLNATLNAVSGVLVIVGYIAIKTRRVTLHKVCMVTALAVSAAFLGCYLYYHIVVRQGESTRFMGPESVRIWYFTILISHIILAAVIVPLALYTAYLGWKDRLQRHVRLARWVLPMWLYVSVTGVVVYWMLYHLYPGP